MIDESTDFEPNQSADPDVARHRPSVRRSPAAVPYTRIEATAAGGSRFGEGEIMLGARTVVAGVPTMLIGALSSAASVVYVRSDAFDSTPHPAPARQWVIMLRGTIEVTVGDGEARRFGPGDLVLAADTEGDGHTTVAIGDPPFEALFIPVDPAWSDS
jgi:hypothetical protein